MTRTLTAALALSLLAGVANAQVPTYSVEVIAPFNTTTILTGASDAGHVVGWQVVNGQLSAFTASQGTGITTLPLPAGYLTAAAMDVNSSGVVVGAVDNGGFPFDGGEPAIWTPDGSGSYTPIIPQQFAQLDSPIGTLGVNGGMAVGVSDAGTVIGWTRYQGFQGGPTTLFSTEDPPVNIGALGFNATVRAINNNDVIVGDGFRFNLNTLTGTPLGVPAPVSTVNFNAVIGYAINDSNEVVAAARRATSGNEIWLTYLHNDADGWSPLDPTDIPQRFVGFYDNNNQGDVAATGGILFAEEGVLVQSINSLIDPADAHWDVSLGFIDNDRRFLATAFNTLTGENAIVMLIPDTEPCAADTNGDGALTPADFNAWVVAFNTNAAECDQNNDGLCSPSDFNAWITNYNNGCQ